MSQTEQKEAMSLMDRLWADAQAGQQDMLEADLKAGFSLSYHDDQGNLVQKHPDGTITLLKHKKDIT